MLQCYIQTHRIRYTNYLKILQKSLFHHFLNNGAITKYSCNYFVTCKQLHLYLMLSLSKFSILCDTVSVYSVFFVVFYVLLS